jgi:NAD(P)-dependent dehydrogenase (short-subunit alcohol dehydrogenase family)
MERAKVTAVVGVGPGLGAAVARRFAREGFAVGLMARGGEKLERFRDEIARDGGTAAAIPADAADPASVEEAFRRLRADLGPPEVLIYNAGAYVPGGVLELDLDRFEQAWRVGCFGALLAVRQVLPGMIERNRGTIIFTGASASLRGSARFAGLAVGKFGLRALAQSLAREAQPLGVHVAHVIIDGQIDTERVRARLPDRADDGFLRPEAIAEAYWRLHVQDRTAWTHELDLRPLTERF